MRIRIACQLQRIAEPASHLVRTSTVAEGTRYRRNSAQRVKRVDLT